MLDLLRPMEPTIMILALTPAARTRRSAILSESEEPAESCVTVCPSRDSVSVVTIGTTVTVVVQYTIREPATG